MGVRRRRYQVLIAGVGLIVAGLAFWGTNAYRLRWLGPQTSTAAGVVVDLDRSPEDNGPDVYAPIVEFTTSDGATARFESWLSTQQPPRVGSEVTVGYDPTAPGRAHIKGYDDRPLFSRWTYLGPWAWAVPVMLIGVYQALIGTNPGALGRKMSLGMSERVMARYGITGVDPVTGQPIDAPSAPADAPDVRVHGQSIEQYAALERALAEAGDGPAGRAAAAGAHGVDLGDLPALRDAWRQAMLADHRLGAAFGRHFNP